MEVSWRPPQHPNGVITGYEVRRDGEVVYVGTESRYHDFTLLPSVVYSYTVTANNSKGSVSSTAATAKTHPSAPSGVGLPLLTPLRANQVIIFCIFQVKVQQIQHFLFCFYKLVNCFRWRCSGILQLVPMGILWVTQCIIKILSSSTSPAPWSLRMRVSSLLDTSLCTGWLLTTGQSLQLLNTLQSECFFTHLITPSILWLAVFLYCGWIFHILDCQQTNQSTSCVWSTVVCDGLGEYRREQSAIFW